MANVLDFTKKKKEYFTVKLHDEKRTVLMIGTPTKAVLNEFTSIDADSMDEDTIDELYRVCARVMSFNKGGIEITPEYLGKFFDIDDITTFFTAYAEFITSITNSKN